MKYFVAFLLFAVSTVTGEYAIGSEPKTSVAQPDAGAGLGDDSTLIHRPTPPPSSAAQSAAPKEKKPVTGILTKDEKGKTGLTSFAPSDTVYLLWKDPTGAKGDKIRVAWYAEDTGKAFPKNKKLSEFTQTLPGPGAFGSSIAPGIKGGMPVGKYRAELYENAKLDLSLKFTVVK